MKSHAFLFFIIASLMLSLPALAQMGSDAAGRFQERENIGEGEEKSSSYTVGQWTYKKLKKAQEHLGKSEYKEALAALLKLREREEDLNPHEMALTWQTYAYVYATQDKMSKAIEAFEKCLSFNALPAQAAQTARFNLGQLYMSQEKFDKAIHTFEIWLKKVSNPSPQAHYIIATAYVQIKKMKRALIHARKSVFESEKPKESWLQLLLAILFQNKQIREAVPVLQYAATYFPKKNYFLQLANAFREIGEEEHALAAFELAYAKNYLDQATEMVLLAQLYLYHAMPYKAAEVLATNIKNKKIPRNQKNLALLSSAYLRSKELKQALKPLSEAAALSEDGELYMRLAQLYIQLHEWKKATQSLKQAIKKGKLRNKGQVHLLLGIAYINTDQKRAARQSLKQAKQDKKTEKSAKHWLNYLARN